jgi:ATP-dependent Lhr-like helicase
MDEIEQTLRVRNLLKYSWVPFFSRFGKLTAIQVQAIPEIFVGKNVIVSSPTASGKTEAVVAPVAERLKKENWRGLAVVYVVPTRALANDTLERVKGPLEEMGIYADLKHGDKPYLSHKNPLNFLITTPESLDSLICRQPQLFAELRTIILDEIHLIDNTYRGDQLRCLLWRLAQLSRFKFNTHLLSATLSSPEQLAKRYVNEFEIVTVPGHRAIEAHFCESHVQVYHLSRERNWKKLLVFCNLREKVEEIADHLSQIWKPYPVVAHHGSLSRKFRQETETVLKEASTAVGVATSTLEVGIDIGDIDLIVLAEPPWSLHSLLQRIGRGNRRENVTRVAAIVTTQEERELLENMFEAAAKGNLPHEQYKRELSVVVQQALSFVFQNHSGVDFDTLIEFLSILCTQREARDIVESLQQQGWLQLSKGQWYPTTRLMDVGRKGEIHSNIPDATMYKVVNIETGKEVGQISGIFDEVFVLGGKLWKVVAFENWMIKVRPVKERAKAPQFRRHKGKGKFYPLLPSHLKSEFAVETPE